MQKIAIYSMVKWVLSKHAMNITTATGNGPAMSNVHVGRAASSFKVSRGASLDGTRLYGAL